MELLTIIVAKKWIFFRMGDLLIIPYAAGYYHVMDITMIESDGVRVITNIDHICALQDVTYDAVIPPARIKTCRDAANLYFHVKVNIPFGIYQYDISLPSTMGTMVRSVYHDIVDDVY